MVRLFRLMLFVMLSAVGVDSDNEIAVLQALKPPNIAPNVLHAVMEPPPIPDLAPPPPKLQEAPLIDSRASL